MTMQLAFILMLVAACAAEKQQKPGLNITVLHVNDHHSHLSAEKFKLDVSSYGLQTTNAATVEVSYGGYPRLVSLFRQLAAVSKNVVKIHAGDAITGSSFYNLYQGQADAEMMSHICFDMFELGNHEFDNGDAGLAKFLDFLKSYQESCPEMPVLGANVVPGPSSPLLGKIENYTIKTFGSTEKVGFIGVDTSVKVMASSKPDRGTVLTDEVKAAQWNIDELRKAGVNHIVLVSHLGYDNDLELAPKLSGVDVIIGGDSHTLLSDIQLMPGWAPAGHYPTIVTNADGEKVCIVQAWEYAHALGELNVMFDAEGALLSCEGDPKFPFDGENIDASPTKLSAADADIVKARLEATPNFIAVTEETSTKEALGMYIDKMGEKMSKVIAQVPEQLCYERVPGMGRSNICNVAATGQHGSDLNGLFAKVFLETVADGDLCIINAGSVRADIAAGPLTFADVYTVLPFQNQLMQIKMTGQQIKQVLEDAVDYVTTNSAGSGGYPYAAGLRFDVNATLSKGSRVANIDVNPHLSGEWVALESSRIYTVVTLAYLGLGKDGFVTFGKLVERAGEDEDNISSVMDLFIDCADAVIKYAEARGVLMKIPIDEYSTKSFAGLELVLSAMRAARWAQWHWFVFTCFGFIVLGCVWLMRKCKDDHFEDRDLRKPFLMI